MSTSDDIKKELEEEKKEFYGEEAVGGSAQDLESDDDVTQTLEDVVGGKINTEEPFSVAEEVEVDEDLRRGKDDEEEEE